VNEQVPNPIQQAWRVQIVFVDADHPDQTRFSEASLTIHRDGDFSRERLLREISRAAANAAWQLLPRPSSAHE
jgi:hypothetical protein